MLLCGRERLNIKAFANAAEIQQKRRSKINILQTPPNIQPKISSSIFCDIITPHPQPDHANAGSFLNTRPNRNAASSVPSATITILHECCIPSLLHRRGEDFQLAPPACSTSIIWASQQPHRFRQASIRFTVRRGNRTGIQMIAANDDGRFYLTCSTSSLKAMPLFAFPCQAAMRAGNPWKSNLLLRQVDQRIGLIIWNNLQTTSSVQHYH